MSNAYMLYVEKYGKVKSGNKLDRNDYGKSSIKGFVEYSNEEKLAVTLAAQDVKDEISLRSKEDLEAQIKKLLG